MSNKIVYATFGTVQARGGVYIERAADQKLLELCQSQEFAYILTSRQMGKSSVMVRTANRLEELGYRKVVIDLTGFGAQMDAETWYLGLLTNIQDDLELDVSVPDWWAAHSHLSIPYRFQGFLQDLVLNQVKEPVVIFVDEIDTTLDVNFTDDFYVGIRFLYNARAKVPELRRLSFVLIGVASPDELIDDPKRTPFNIGHRVDLRYFNPEEALPLADGLGLPPDQARQVLSWIIDWTSGHPYLSVLLCSEVAERKQPSWTQADIESLVEETLLGENGLQNSNLQYVQKYMLLNKQYNTQMLELYGQILSGKEISYRNHERSHIHLKLSGLAVTGQEGKLAVGNRIYREFFNADWVRETLDEITPFAADMKRWQEGGFDVSALLRGSVLAGAIDWANRKEHLTRAEREFLEASKTHQHREELRGRYNKVLKIMVASLIVLLAYAAFTSVWLYDSLQDLRSEAKKNEKLSQDIAGLLDDIQRAKDAGDKTKIEEYEEKLKEAIARSNPGQSQAIEGLQRRLVQAENRAGELQKRLDSQESRFLHEKESLELELEQTKSKLSKLEATLRQLLSPSRGNGQNPRTLSSQSTSRELAEAAWEHNSIAMALAALSNDLALRNEAEQTESERIAEEFLIQTLQQQIEKGAVVRAFVYHPEGGLVVTTDSKLSIWAPRQKSGESRRIRSRPLNKPIRRLAIRPDDNSILGLREDGYMERWPCSNGRELKRPTSSRIPEIPKRVRIAFNPNGSIRGLLRRNGQGHFAEFVSTLLAESNSVTIKNAQDFVFLDNRKVVVTNDDGAVQIVNATTGASLIKKADCHKGPVEALSALGGHIATGCADGWAQVRKADSLETVWRFPHLEPVSSVSLGLAKRGERRLLLTGSKNGWLRLWDLDNGRLWRRWQIDGEVAWVDFRGDGEEVAVLSSLGQAYLFTVKKSQIEELAKARLKKGNWNDQKCRSLLRRSPCPQLLRF